MSCQSPRSLTGIGLAALTLLSAGCHHIDRSSGLTPAAQGLDGSPATFLDVDRNGIANAGDVVLVRFTQPLDDVQAQFQDLILGVVRDSLGDGATASVGATPNEMRIRLGTRPRLKTRQIFDEDAFEENSPSGLLAAGGEADVIPGLVGHTLDLAAGEDAVVAIDHDRDGRMDLVVSDDTRLMVLLGDGAGALVEGPAFAFEELGEVHGLRAADLDRDGFMDLLQLTSSGLRVWMREGGDYVLTETSYGSDVRDLALLDHDRDGILDIALADAAQDVLLIGDGNGLFQAAGSGTSGTTHAVLAADMDADGDLDLVKARTLDGTEQLLLLTWTGTTFVESVLREGLPVRTLRAGRIDRDGSLDLALGLAGAEDEGSLRILYGLTGGEFEEREHQTAGEDVDLVLGDAPAVDLLLADVDSDGNPDVMLATAGGLRLFMNLGPSFTSTADRFTADVSAMAGADFDRDGDLDVATVGGAGRLFTGSLAGTWGGIRFQGTQELGLLRTHALTAADVDGDGSIEILTGNNETIELWNEDGGTYVLQLPLDLPGTRVQDLALFDIDRDGDVDILAALEVGQGNAFSGLYVALQDSSGGFETFSLAQAYVTPASALSLCDFDRDGNVDVVLAGEDGNEDQLIPNSGYDNGQWLGFDAPIALGEPVGQGGNGPLLVHTSDVRFYDVDRDGDEDLLTAHVPGEPNRVWINEGGTFIPTLLPSSLELNCRSIVMGDLDLDGDLDLVTGNAVGERIWLRQGDEFIVFESALSNSDTFEVALDYIDGDAFLDLVIANRGNMAQEGVQVWINQGVSQGSEEGVGPGEFWRGFDSGDQRPHFVLKEGSVGSVLTVDFDRDGDVDVVGGSVTEGQPNTLWSNQ